jgi:hypothetical protein
MEDAPEPPGASSGADDEDRDEAIEALAADLLG